MCNGCTSAAFPTLPFCAEIAPSHVLNGFLADPGSLSFFSDEVLLSRGAPYLLCSLPTSFARSFPRW